MIGQGRPKSNSLITPKTRLTTQQRQSRLKIAMLFCQLLVVVPLVVVLCCAPSKSARAQDLTQLQRIQVQAEPQTQRPPQQPSPEFRLRVSWGGGQNQSWQGSITADNGIVSNVLPLGLEEFLASTAHVVDQRQINIFQNGATNYDGFDFTFTGDLDSNINISLAAEDGTQPPVQETFSVRSLIQAAWHRPLDNLGNHLTVARAPGDTIKVDFAQDHLVFGTGATLEINIAVNHGKLKKGPASIRTSIVRARENGPAVWSETEAINIDENGNSAPASDHQIPLPRQEGVYDLLIEVEKNWLGINQPANNKALRALNSQNGSIRRRIQFVVLHDHAVPIEPYTSYRTIAEILPAEIAPTGPNWRIKSYKRKLAVLGNQKSTLTQTNGQPLVELSPGGWHAVRLPTPDLGQPHVVEIEYPDNRATALGMSILDQSDQGQVPLQGADSGIHIPQSIVVNDNGEQQIRRHRITFWPNSKSVYLLLANQSADNFAQFGKISVLTGTGNLPNNSPPPVNFAGNRKRMAYYQSPSFMDDFGVKKFFDPTVGQSLDDWVTFYHGTARLIAYLKSNHYQGAVMTVTADGSSIYPGVHINNTPAHDSGIFLTEGQDPFRKDVLRMILMMFEREGLTLIPAFTFSHPLAEIEAIRDPALSLQSFDIAHPSAISSLVPENHPRYNPLSESVQIAVLNTLRRFTQRYREFGSIGGISLICKPNTYTMMPGSKSGNNPHTVNRFLRSLNDPSGKPTEAQWLQWQANKMTLWYQAIADLVDTNFDQGQLFIAPVGLYEADDAFSTMCPNLHSTVNFEQLIKRFGFDQMELATDPRIVLLAPQSLATAETLSASRVQINANESRQVIDFFAAGAQTGTIFNHRGLWAHFAQLQSLPPFNHHAGRLMRPIQLTPAGKWNRQRYITAIRQQDSLFLIDGGRGLAQGQEKSIENFAVTFAQLPRIKFSDVLPLQDHPVPRADQTLIVRQAKQNGATFLYAVNDSPWDATVAIQIGESDDEIRQVGLTDHETITRPNVEYFPFTNADRRQIFDPKSGLLSIQLPAFGIAGGKLVGPHPSVGNYSYQRDQGIEQLLRKKTYALQAKLNLAQNAPPLSALKDAGFERDQESSVSSWDFESPSSDEVTFDDRQGHQSDSSLRLTSQDDPVWIRSNRFSPPDTGRISVTAYLKIEDLATQPPLRIAIEGETQHATYYRFGVVGSLAPEDASKQITNQWRRFAVHFDDLPTGQLRDLRIGFDLMGKGTVWIDNVTVHDRWFDGNDAKAITQLLAGAAPLMENPKTYESCRRILEGYWPKFLDHYIDIESAANAPGATSETEARAADKNSSNIFRRVKSSSPSLLRRWRNNFPQR